MNVRLMSHQRVYESFMRSPLSSSSLKITALLCLGLFLTSLSGWFPAFGGAPGSSGDSYGIPVQWRFRKWRPSIPMFELVHNEDGQLVERYVPYSGTPGGIKTRYQSLPFALDVLFWAVVSWATMLALRRIVYLKSTSMTSRTG